MIGLVAAAFATAPASAIRAAYQTMEGAITQRNGVLLSSLLTADFRAHNLDGTTDGRAAHVKDTLDYDPGVSVASVRIVVNTLAVHGTSANAEATLTVLGTYTYNGSAKPLRGVWRNADEWIHIGSAWKLRSTTEREEIAYVGDSLVQHRQEQLPPSKAAVAELRRRAVLVPTLALGARPDDLSGIGAAIGDARIVGMGEGSHGSNEFFAFKDRLFKYLVEKKGFTVFAMEAAWGAGLNVDRYIKTGQGTAQEAVASLGFWTWDAPQVVDLIQWMRNYNAQPGPHRTLTFVGIDMQQAMATIGFLTTYLKAYDPAEVPVARGALDCAVDAAELYSNTPAAGCRAQIVALGAHLATLNNAPNVAIARESVVNLLQFLDWKNVPDDARLSVRDRDMAANVQWIASNDATAKIAVWAHNGHVGASGVLGSYSPMGSYLRSAFGTDYYVIGQTFGSGTVRALVRQHGLQSVPVPASRNDTISQLFAPLRSVAFLDLRSLPKKSALYDFFAAAHGISEIGAMVNTQQPGSQRIPMVVPSVFDGLVYVPTSTATTEGTAYSKMRREVHAGDTTWQISGEGFDDVAVKVGAKDAALTNADGLNAAANMLLERFNAAAYAGRTVTVKGEVELRDLSGFVVPYADAEEADGTMILSSQGDEVGRTANGKWVPFTVTLKVPQNASYIDAGAWAQGLGTFAVRSVTISPAL